MSDRLIESELNDVLGQLETLEESVLELSHRWGSDPMKVQYPDGQLAMAPIIVAKAQVLAALAPIIKARESSDWWRNLGKNLGEQ